MQYDEHANNHEVDAKLNEDVEISLSESRTAGYHWVTKKKGEPVCELLNETVQPKSTSVGGAGHHLWQFRVVALGEAEIELHYQRSWENPTEPARTFMLKVRAHP
jgi:predicted secreted protein